MGWGISLPAELPSNEQEDMADRANQNPEGDLAVDMEHALVARLRDGDPEAFAILVAQFANRLMRFAFHAVGSRDAAEDVVQQVFVQLWERRTSFYPEHLRAYLFAAVRNRTLKVQRAESVRSSYRTDVQEEAMTGPASAIVPSPENRILVSATIQAAIERLSGRRRLAIRLRLEEEMTHAEIAEVLGISPVAAQHLVTRAIADLRRILWGS